MKTTTKLILGLKVGLRMIIRLILKPSSSYFSVVEYVLKKELNQNPNDTFSLWFLGDLYVEHRKYAEAEPLLEKLVGKVKNDKQLKLLLSKAYFGQQKHENVIELLINYDGLRDKDEHNYYLAASLIKLGNYTEAITFLRKRVQHYSKDYIPFAQLGYAYYMEKQYNLALDAYRQAELLNPTQIEIKESILLCMEHIPGMRRE